jgi:hypothetical protein
MDACWKRSHWHGKQKGGDLAWSQSVQIAGCLLLELILAGCAYLSVMVMDAAIHVFIWS